MRLSRNLSGVLLLLSVCESIRNLHHTNLQTQSLWHSSMWHVYNDDICNNPGLVGINWKYETQRIFFLKENWYAGFLANPTVPGIGVCVWGVQIRCLGVRAGMGNQCVLGQVLACWHLFLLAHTLFYLYSQVFIPVGSRITSHVLVALPLLCLPFRWLKHFRVCKWNNENRLFIPRFDILSN